MKNGFEEQKNSENSSPSFGFLRGHIGGHFHLSVTFARVIDGYFKALGVSSAIQSVPHCSQTRAGTLRTTTTPKPRSTVNVVVPFTFDPPQMGQVFLALMVSSEFDSPIQIYPDWVRRR